MDLPLTKAVIQEVYRLKPPAPFGIPHCTSEDVELSGFVIPKNTEVITNLWAAHRDPSKWPNPEKFVPSRHINAKKQFNKSKFIIPFGIGSRSCLGENVARMEVFMFFVAMMQKFTVKSDQMEALSLSDRPGLLNSPGDQQIVMTER